MRTIDKMLNFGTAIAVVGSLVLVAGMLRQAPPGPEWHGANPTVPHANRSIKDWHTLAHGDGWIGDSTARVTILEFADFQCPFCRRFFSTEQAVRLKHPRDVAVLFRHLPLSYHRSALPAAIAAECAAQQGHFERYHDLLFSVKQPLDSVSFAGLALTAGIRDTVRFASCMRDTASAKVIQADVDAAKRIGARGTPTLVINGVMLASMPAPDSLEALIGLAERGLLK